MKKRAVIIPILIIASLSFGLSLLLFANKQSTISQAKTTSEIPSGTPSNEPINERILFVSKRTGNYDIYWMDLSTKKTINLTNNAWDDMNPQVSPDGKFMAFYSNRDGDAEIYKMDLATHDLTKLTDNNVNDYDPSYSPDGSHILFKSNRDNNLGNIFIMQANGEMQKNLTSMNTDDEDWDPVFSNDGSKIYFTVRKENDHLTDELYVMNPDGTDRHQITMNTVPDWYLSVNPQNDSLVFISKRNPKAKDDLFLSNLDGTDRIRLTNLTGNEADPSWNATGDKIIFINDVDKDYDLYIMGADGKNVIKIEDTPSDELAPIFLPS